MGTFKIDNDEIWNDYVKTGEVKGFSIEGLFGHNLVQQAKIEFEADTVLTDLEEQEAILILSEIRAVIKKDNRYKGKKRVDMESFSDYGDGVANNAKRGIELNEKNGNKCATPVGKVRAQQLAQKKPISVETVKRMYSYLSRAETYYDESDTSACGTISYLLWGGKAALSWSRNKLRELGLLQESEAQPSVASTYPGEAASGSIAPALLSEDYGMLLPKDIPVVLQADDEEYERGLIVTYLSNGGYDVQYWYDKPNNIVSAEIKIDGESITPNGKLVHIGYHPELD
jgi:hypothetical protein